MNTPYQIYNNNGNKKIVLSLENNFPVRENSDNSNILMNLEEGELESTNKEVMEADGDSSEDSY